MISLSLFNFGIPLDKTNTGISELRSTEAQVFTFPRYITNPFQTIVEACVLVYDVTNEQSFKHLEKWMGLLQISPFLIVSCRTDEFMSKANPAHADAFPILALGNKTDL